MSSLTSVTLNEGLETIGDSSGTGAFSGTSITSITIPDSVTTIGGSFLPSSIVSLNIGSGVTSLGNGLFSGYSSLTNITLSEGIITITDGVFSSIPLLESITIPDSVTTITNGAFSGSSSLTSVDLGEGVETISGGAFSGTNISNIVIPASVSTISGSAFSSSVDTESVYFKGNAPSVVESGVFSGTDLTIYYYEGKTGFDEDWNTYNTVMLPKPVISNTYSSNIESDSITLNTTVTSSDNEMDKTTVIGFNYGPTTEYGDIYKEESNSYSTGSFSYKISDLDCNTTYHYQAYATNDAGTTYGEDTTFTTSKCSSHGSKVVGGSVYTSSSSKNINNQNITNTSNSTDNKTVLTFTRILKLNILGDDVKILQQWLNNHGYIVTSTGLGSLNNETTKFGPLTKKAVIAFQKANNLDPDGIVGPLTLAKMNSLN